MSMSRGHHRMNTQICLGAIESSDGDSTAIYERWHDVRCRSTEELAALQALMIRAAALGSLGEAWVELQPRFARGRDRAWWATIIGGLVQAIGATRPTSDAEDREPVRRLWRAWETAARAGAPVWASVSARMPRLMRVSPQLPLNTAFHRLSTKAQVLLVSLLGEADNPNAGCGSERLAL